MSEAAYRRDLRALFRGLWAGVFTPEQFQNLMFNAIDRGLNSAWRAGAKSAGVLPSEITMEEQLQLSAIILRESAFVPGVAAFIEEKSKANKGLLRSVFTRLEKWVNRWRDVFNKGKMSARGDPKLKWVLGPTKEHCTTCSKLSNKVKRKSQWEAAGIYPQNYPNDQLECGGWECRCFFEITDEPMSKGPLPKTP